MSFGRQYLTSPDLFPARASGEPWGDATVEVDFVGGPYRFQGLSAAQADVLRSRYAELLVPESGDDAVEVRVFRAAPGDFRAPDPAPWRPSDMDFVFAPDAVSIAALNVMGRLDFDPALAGAMWTSLETPPYEVEDAFENFFRLVLAYRLHALGGALLHSAAVVREGRAWVFLGPSGAGKTTISRLSQEAGLVVLSDDMNAVLPSTAGTVVEKLPFAGDLGRTGTISGRVPLGGFLRLRKADTHALHPLPRPQAVALLAGCSPFLNADPLRGAALLSTLEGIVAGTKTATLEFRPDPGFWSLLATR